MKRNKILIACGLCLTAALVSCADNPPTPYEQYKLAKLEREALSVLRVHGYLTDASGKPMSDVKVSTSSGRFEQEAYTGSDGHFSVMTKFEPNDVIDFRFEAVGLEWTESLGFIPKGIEKLRLRFQQDTLGRVKLSAYEYERGA